MKALITGLAAAAVMATSISAFAMASLPDCWNPLPENIPFCTQFYGLPPASNDINHHTVEPKPRPEPEKPGGEGSPGEGGSMETFSEPAPAQGD